MERRTLEAAAVFTSNLAAAPPVQLSRTHLARTGGRAVAVIVNSGNANAATGAPGRAHAERMAALVAEGLGCAPAHVLVCSTGLIGEQLPMDKLLPGVRRAVDLLSDGGGRAAAEAIMTTDSVSKTASYPATQDDASEGYERGTGVSKDWYEAITAAAVTASRLIPSAIE